MATFDLAEASVEFTSDTEANWNNFPLPIPANVVVYTVDTQKFKRGDGSRRYSELPEGPSIAGIAAGESALVNVLTQLIPTDEDCLIVIEDEIYKASTTKLSDLVTRLSAIANKDTIQNANMDAIASQFGMVDASIIPGDVGKLAVIGNHKMKPGVLPETIVSIAPVNPVNIRKFETYSDLACTVPCDSFNYDSVYYAKIEGCHDTADTDNLSFSLTEASEYVTITAIGRGIFKINVGRPVATAGVVLTATVAYNTDTISVNKTVTINQYVPILVGVYGGANDDIFNGVVVLSTGEIICCGRTASEGLGGAAFGDTLIVKFDSSLNILAKKRYGGIDNDVFLNVGVDSANNIYAVGSTKSEGLGGTDHGDALIVKFDSNLSILAKKRYGGTYNEVFNGVIIDSGDNIYTVGWTLSDSSGGSSTGDALIIKFNTSLTIVAKKRYGGTNEDQFVGITIDSTGNIYAVGATKSEGLGGTPYGDALIIKFDSSLNVLIKKRYGGTGDDIFLEVGIDSANNVYAVGYTTSEGNGSNDALIVKFDSNLNILAKKRYGGTGTDYFRNVAVDSKGNIIAVGYTTSEGNGSNDALIVKFDSNLNILAKKRYGGTGDDIFRSINIDQSDNIICVGNVSTDVLIMKFPSDLPAGTFVSSTFPNLILADSALTLADSNLTLANITTLTLADSNLTFADVTTLTLADSNLTYTLGEI